MTDTNCPKCGGKIPADVKVCMHCQHRFYTPAQKVAIGVAFAVLIWVCIQLVFAIST